MDTEKLAWSELPGYFREQFVAGISSDSGRAALRELWESLHYTDISFEEWLELDYSNSKTGQQTLVAAWDKLTASRQRDLCEEWRQQLIAAHRYVDKFFDRLRNRS